MKKTLLLSACAIVSMAMSAQVASEPVNIKAGAFNFDLIVEEASAVKDLPAGIPDDHMCQRVSQGCLDAFGIEGTGVPDDYANGFTTESGHAYKFMPYTGNNAIVIPSSEAGISLDIAFEQPVDASKFNTVGLIAVSHLGDYYPQADITLQYADGTTEVVTKEIVDWCQNPGGSYPAPLYSMNKRVRPTNGNDAQAHIEDCNNFFHEITFPIAKNLVGINVRNNVTAKHEWGWPVIVIMAATAFQDESSGIQQVDAAAQQASNTVYDLSGRSLSTVLNPSQPLPKGLYIQNGRKFVVK